MRRRVDIVGICFYILAQLQRRCDQFLQVSAHASARTKNMGVSEPGTIVFGSEILGQSVCNDSSKNTSSGKSSHAFSTFVHSWSKIVSYETRTIYIFHVSQGY